MNKSRTRKKDHMHRLQRQYKRTPCHIRKWIFANTAFERLNPEE